MFCKRCFVYIGEVSADGKGFGPGQGPGAGLSHTDYNTGPTGGSHGGRGGRGSHGILASKAYGTIYTPERYGSGGGNGSTPGGNGAGTIIVDVTDMFRLEGRLHSNGDSSQGGGGGAGGSIIIRTVNFDGEGSIETSGGQGGSRGGGGGGGRIAVYYTGERSFIGDYKSYGGEGTQKGAAGTVYIEDRKNQSHPHRILRINNGVDRHGVLRVDEYKQLILTGNTLQNHAISYQAPSGVKISTTALPYCHTIHCTESILRNLLDGVSSYYATTHASPVITYEFPVPLVLQYLLIYPTCGISSHNTLHYVRVYRDNDVIVHSRDWVDTSNCVEGQPGRVDVKQSATKVLITLIITIDTVLYLNCV